ncbi:MAG: hypothetical protein AB7P14_07935 [Blastocatellales bacterium]
MQDNTPIHQPVKIKLVDKLSTHDLDDEKYESDCLQEEKVRNPYDCRVGSSGITSGERCELIEACAYIRLAKPLERCGLTQLWQSFGWSTLGWITKAVPGNRSPKASPIPFTHRLQISVR